LIPASAGSPGAEGDGHPGEPRGEASIQVSAARPSAEKDRALAEPRGDALILAARLVEYPEGKGSPGSAVPSGAASVSRSLVRPDGGGASTPIPPPVERSDAERPSMSTTRAGDAGLGWPRPQRHVTGLPQVGKVEMRERYAELLASAPPTASQADIPPRKEVRSLPETTFLQVRAEGRRQTSPSSESVSSFGSGGSWEIAGPKMAGTIDLRLNAEVVISGRAQPGQTVQVNGRWLKVGDDGTFSVRLALPVVKEHNPHSEK